jgi:uncharacterized protein with LGFP repeats
VRAFLVRSRGCRWQQAAGDRGAPPIITRADWHATSRSAGRAVLRRRDPPRDRPPHRGSNSYTKAQSASIVRAIELYHVQGNGWNDIGYNFLVDKYGQVFEGRTAGSRGR